MLKRILIVLLPWLLCGPALLLSLSMGVGAGLETYDHLAQHPDSRSSDAGALQIAATGFIAVAVPAAWVALLVLSIAWVRQRRLAPLWPWLGTAVGLLALLAFGLSLGPMGSVMGGLYASPGIGLALLLCRYHLRGPTGPAASAAPSGG